MEFIRLFRSPDPEESIPPTDSPTRKRRNIPKADGDLATLATTAAPKWLGTPGLTLMWTTSNAFETAAKAFKVGLQQRRDTGALRPGYTYTMNELDDHIEEALKEVKIYIQRKFKSAGAAAQYPRYGLIHRGDRWIMPTDRDDLKVSLNSMAAAIAADGFGDEEYGNMFWQDLNTAYNTAFMAAKNTDGSVSQKVGAKEAGKEYIVKVLNALIHLLQANYPDTYEEELRAWGFQKEDY